MEPNIFDVILGIVSIPIQIYHQLIWGILEALTFDVLQLGPYLPIGG